MMPITQEQPNKFATRFKLVLAANMQKAIFAQFVVNVAVSRYIMVTLSVEVLGPDSKDSRIVCLHIQNIDI